LGASSNQDPLGDGPLVREESRCAGLTADVPLCVWRDLRVFKAGRNLGRIQPFNFTHGRIGV
jgi:hypothetical protein